MLTRAAHAALRVATPRQDTMPIFIYYADTPPPPDDYYVTRFA